MQFNSRDQIRIAKLLGASDSRIRESRPREPRGLRQFESLSSKSISKCASNSSRTFLAKFCVEIEEYTDVWMALARTSDVIKRDGGASIRDVCFCDITQSRDISRNTHDKQAIDLTFM